MSLPSKTIADRDMVLSSASTLSDAAFLGYGYDVTRRYCHPDDVRASIINMATFLQKEPDRFQRKTGSSSDTKIVAAENAMDYCSKLTENLGVDVKFKAVFSGALSLKFNYKNECSSKYSFGSYFLIMRKAVASLVVDKSDLRPHLRNIFINDFQTKDCRDLIRLYGTHVITSMTLGGRLEILCRSIIDDASKAYSIEAGVKASAKKIFTVSSDTSYDESTVNKNKELTINIETVGGDPAKFITDSFDYTKPSPDLKSNFSAWQNSLTTENMTFVDMEKGSLIPIADLIPDDPLYAGKKKMLADEVDKYLRDSQFAMVDRPKPFYRYYSADLDDHFYTMNWKELKYGNGAYNFERIECMIYDIKVPGSVPLYRYYDGFDHFYTTNWSELQNGKFGYTFEGICGYVFADNRSDAKLVPLYRSVNSSRVKKRVKTDHFYTCDRSEFKGIGTWQDENIQYYVYPPGKEVYPPGKDV